MTNKKASALLCATLLVFTAACSGPHSRTKEDALVGGAAGAATGAIVGDGIGDAAIGGVAGAALGGFIGYLDEHDR